MVRCASGSEGTLRLPVGVASCPLPYASPKTAEAEAFFFGAFKACRTCQSFAGHVPQTKPRPRQRNTPCTANPLKTYPVGG